jgi:hypothetical protein
LPRRSISVFSLRPSKSEHLGELLEGLEASIIAHSQALRDNDVGRLDSSYFLKSDVERLHNLNALPHDRIGDVCYVTDGIHTSISFEEGSGIKVISAKHPKNGFLDLASVEEISEQFHRENPRTALRENDVLISTVGTIGNSAVVRSEALPANSDRHVAILRTLDDGIRPVSPEYISIFLNSSYGRMQTRRETTGNVQPNLFLVKIRDIKLPRFSEQLENRLSGLSLSSLAHHRAHHNSMIHAEETLLKALGLANWLPPEPLSYSALASDVFDARRFDARFFAPRIQALLDILRRGGQSLSDLATPRRQKFRPNKFAKFNYIEIGDIDGAGATTSSFLACDDAPSRATWHVRADDIITSTVRPIRRLSAQIAPEQDGYVVSSGFVVIDPKEIAPELLLTFLRLPVICELLDLYASASMYPAVTEAHILGLPFPKIDEAVATQVVSNVREAREAKKQATKFVDAAKRAVEIAIEDGENASVAFLASIEGID